MDTKDKETRKEGVYLSNFVATSMSFFVLVLAVAAGFFGSSYFKTSVKTGTTGTTTTAAQPGQPAQPAVTLDQIKAIFSENVVRFGDASRKVLVVEASDPSCPYCSIAAGKNGELNKQVSPNFTLVADGGTYLAPVEEIKKLVDAGQASYAYIYRPGHGNGEMAMKALYCAYDVGKFWPVHDLLMSGAGYDLINNTVKNDKTKTDTLVAFLKDAIDPSELKSCIDSGKYDKRLQEDTSLTDTLGVSGTPGFFVNDKLFAGAYSYKDMQPIVDAALR